MVDHRDMKAYSEDLRQQVVQAVEQRGTSKSQAARLFGISLSSVKRYTKLASEGDEHGAQCPRCVWLLRALRLPSNSSIV